MGPVVLDAGVVIAHLDDTDPHNEAVRAALRARRGHELVLPASAYAETLVQPFRAGGRRPAVLDAFLDATPIRIEPIGREIARLAARLRARRSSLRLPDALVIATGEVIDAAEILTTDLELRRVSRRVVPIASRSL